MAKKRSPFDPVLSEEILAKARSLFPHTRQGKTYLNHAATAPMSSRVLEAIISHLTERSSGLIETFAIRDIKKMLACKESVARLVNAESPDRIALLGNTSDGINIVASGMRWKSGDRILLRQEEFPANVVPFTNQRRLGVEIDWIEGHGGETTVEMVEHALTSRTRVVGLSAVQFLTGYRADLEAIGNLCRNRGIIFAVDGIQAVGAMRIDVQRMKIDSLSAGSQKWQMGPQGTGFFYVTEDLQDKIDVPQLGWLGAEEPWDFFNYEQPLASTARRFEGGTRNVPGIWGMEAAISTLLEFGIENIEAHILDLTGYLIERLDSLDGVNVVSPRKRNCRAGIVTIELPASVDSEKIFQSLQERKITVSLRNGRIRYSPHFYVNTDDIDRAADALREMLVNPRYRITG